MTPDETSAEETPETETTEEPAPAPPPRSSSSPAGTTRLKDPSGRIVTASAELAGRLKRRGYKAVR